VYVCMYVSMCVKKHLLRACVCVCVCVCVNRTQRCVELLGSDDGPRVRSRRQLERPRPLPATQTRTRRDDIPRGVCTCHHMMPHRVRAQLIHLTSFGTRTHTHTHTHTHVYICIYAYTYTRRIYHYSQAQVRSRAAHRRSSTERVT